MSASGRQVPANTFSDENFCAEEYRHELDDCLAELRKRIENVVDLRVQAAELEVNLASFYNPQLIAKLKLCKEHDAKCEAHHLNDSSAKKN